MFNSSTAELALLLTCASACADGHAMGAGASLAREHMQQLRGERCVALGAADLRTHTPACETDAGAALGPMHPPGVGYQGEAALPVRIAYLTFDDGPSDWTRDFLNILAGRQVRATFFIRAHSWARHGGDLGGSYRDDEGRNIAYADVLAQIVNDGHAIGNHTVDHVDLATLSMEEATLQLDRNETLINAALLAAGVAPRPLSLLRPPFGSPWLGASTPPPEREQRQADIGGLLQERGVTVFWTVDSSDSREWAQGESTSREPVHLDIEASAPSYDDKVARVESTVLESPQVAAGEGVIVLLHDIHNATRDALPVIIDGLRAQGYAFGTIEELVQSRWGRPSWAVTPGPALEDACTPEGQRGCASFTPDESGAVIEVCGRFWRAFEDAGGADRLGSPLAPALDPTAGGAWSQAFERGVIELRPELDAPCNVSVSVLSE